MLRDCAIPGEYRARPRLCPILCPPPNPTECYLVSAPRWKRQSALHLSHLVAIRSVRCNSLILRARNLRDQEVDGSNPFAPTTSKPFPLIEFTQFLLRLLTRL